MTLKLKVPDCLPASGVSQAAFKVFRQSVVTYLEQDTESFNFLPGGIYSTWLSKESNEDGKRIKKTLNEDVKKMEIDKNTIRKYYLRLRKCLKKRNYSVQETLNFQSSYST